MLTLRDPEREELELDVDLDELIRRESRFAADLVRDRLRAPPILTVSEWAELHHYLPSTAAEPGRYRVDRTPYLREILDSFSDPLVERVVFMKSAQIGGSEGLLAILGYFIDQDPAPILLVQTTVEEAEKFSKERVSAMIEASPVLRAKVIAPRSRDGSNTVGAKEFPGGHLGIVGANSPVGLRSRPRRVVLLDEVDAYPASAGREGDPVELAVKRTSTFWTRKIGLISTPTIKGASRIEIAYEDSDQRQYYVRCPHCGHAQTLRFGDDSSPFGLKWLARRPDTAVYLCEHCASSIEERHKRRMLEEGEWRPHREHPTRGYWLNALYSPWFPWSGIVEEWLAAQGKPELLKVFVNTRLAETWEEKGEAPEWQRLYERREDYPIGTCPEGVLFLTVGADVQADRVEAYVWGWGYGRESWLIEHLVSEGDPHDARTWSPVTEWLGRTYPKENGGELPIAAFAIDTGFSPAVVAAWARGVGDRRVMLIKGDHWKNWKSMLGTPSRSEVTYNGKRFGMLLWPVGGALIKLETYGFLRLESPLDGEPFPDGWVHLPMVDDEVCQQLVAEDLVTSTDTRGFTKREWVKRRHRNEALDCRVYARAAAEHVGVSRLVRPEDAPPKPSPPRRRPGPSEDRPPEPEGRSGPRSSSSSSSARGRRSGGWLDRNRKRGGWI